MTTRIVLHRLYGPDDVASVTVDDLVAAGLTPRQATVLWERFCSGNWPTLAELGRRFQVSRNRIGQIEAAALRKLRHPRRRMFARQLMGSALYKSVWGQAPLEEA